MRQLVSKAKGRLPQYTFFRFLPCTGFLFCWQPTVLDHSRTFIRMPPLPSSSQSKKKEYSESRTLGYSMDQMYDIVSDIEKYPEFVPWCTNAKISYRRAGLCRAELGVGFPPLVERYTCTITLAKPHMVKSVATEGRLFNQLVSLWRFSPGLPDRPDTCTLDFSVSFQFRTALHSHIANIFFDEVVKVMVTAFLKRARRVHGEPSMPASSPKIRSSR